MDSSSSLAAAPAAAAPAAAAAPTSTDTTTVTSLSSMLADTALLDMTFVMDCTGSMGSYIHAAQQTIRDIVQEIMSKEKADVRFALIAYRDHPPQDRTYVTQVYKFTKSVKEMRANLDKLSASGGGDGPEAVVDGLHAALKLDYRPQATKVCILIADAPPHGLAEGSGDGFPNGCPCGLDPLTVCREMAANAITLYCVGCEPSITPYRAFFMALCQITGGQYCPLGDAASLHTAVVGGVREEISLERMMRDVDVTMAAHEAKVGAMDEKSRARFLHEELKSKGHRTRHLRSDRGTACEVLPEAVEWSKAASLGEVKKKFTPAPTPTPSGESTLRRSRMECAGLVDSIPEGAKCKSRMRKAAPAGAECLAEASSESTSVLGRLGAFFGGGSLRHKAAAAPTASALMRGDVDKVLERDGPVTMSAPSYAPTAPSFAPPRSYTVEEDAVSLSQCERMMAKSAARSRK